MGKIKMNTGFVLVKKDNSLKQVNGLTMLDASGNCQRGIIVGLPDGGNIFKNGKTVYFQGGTKVVVDNQDFIVVKNEDIYFMVE